MPRRKASPPVERPTGRRRLVELGKDALIVALTVSALLLTAQTPMATQLRGWVSPTGQTAAPAARQPKEAVEPYGIAVRSSRGLYATVYDAGQVERTFDQLSPLLGEALDTAGTPERITRYQWQRLLESPGVYCVFQGKPSLRVLSAWLGEGAGTLESQVQALLLAFDGSRTWLCWRSGEEFGRAPTQVRYETSMEERLESFSPNGAAFAYTLAKTDRAYASADPDVLVPMTIPQPRAYAMSTPNLAGSREELEKLLSALGFQSGVGSAYEAGGGLAINESGDRLRVGPDGTVTFHSGEEEPRYPVAQPGETLSVQRAAAAAWELLNRAADPWKGEGVVFVLTGAEETGEGWSITFHSRLEGIPLLTGTEGWTASFVVAGGRIRDFSLVLRGYTPSGESALLPGQRLAAAALNSESYAGGGKRLTLCYSEAGGGALTAGWVSEE